MSADAALDQVFAALADPTRRHLLDQLRNGPRPVTQLAPPVPISRPAVSRHLRVLTEAGLIQVLPKGRQRICHLQPQPLAAAATYLHAYQTFWQQRLGALAQLAHIQSTRTHDPSHD